MSKAKDFIRKLRHSVEFLKIREARNTDIAIRAITHSNPISVFWISPKGVVLDAGEAHHRNPPSGDRSILADKTYKGYLRGRAAFIGETLYVVIYGENKGEISKRQLTILKKFQNLLFQHLKEKGLEQFHVDAANFIDENGNDILL